MTDVKYILQIHEAEHSKDGEKIGLFFGDIQLAIDQINGLALQFNGRIVVNLDIEVYAEFSPEE